jgi:hypothetical protein
MRVRHEVRFEFWCVIEGERDIYTSAGPSTNLADCGATIYVPLAECKTRLAGVTNTRRCDIGIHPRVSTGRGSNVHLQPHPLAFATEVLLRSIQCTYPAPSNQTLFNDLLKTTTSKWQSLLK